MIYYPINDKLSLSIDCYQSLLANMLVHYDENVYNAGAIWPWLFHIEKENTLNPKVYNRSLFNVNSMWQLFGCTIVETDLDKYVSEDVVSVVVEQLKDNPVIITVDQYYIPYHYPHIFKTEHGEHTMLIKGVNDDSSAFFCLDHRPKYDGMIPTVYLEKGILSFKKNNKHAKIVVIKKEYNPKSSEAIAYNNFSGDLILAKNRLQKSFEHTDKFVLSDILKLIVMAYRNFSHKDFLVWLDKLLKQSWLWELDRICKWTIKYLNTEYPKNILQENIVVMVDLIEKMNVKVLSSIKKLYKCVFANNEKYTALEVLKIEKLYEYEQAAVLKALSLLV